MITKKTSQEIGKRAAASPGKARISAFEKTVAAALLYALGVCAPVWAQSTTQSQMSIGTNTSADSIDDNISSILFTGPYALTLGEGQTLRAVLVSKEAGATLKLGNGKDQGQEWRLVSNSPSWIGTIDVLSGNSLVLPNGAANPVGAYSETNSTLYSTVSLYNGASFKLPARAFAASSLPVPGEVKIGALTTERLNDTQFQDPAVVEVGAEQTLTVENGLSVDPSVGLKKTGTGTLQFLVNGTEKTIVSEDGIASLTNVTSFDFGRFYLENGKVTLQTGTMDVDDADIIASSIYVGPNATLDIQKAGEIEIEGSPGEVVFNAADGSTVNFYVDEFGSTSYVATTYNTYMKLGATTLNVETDLRGEELPTSMVVFSTQDVGQTIYNIDDIDVIDTLLGKRYVVDPFASTADQLVLTLEKNEPLANIGKTPNEKAVGKYFDALVESDRYNDDEYLFLGKVEDFRDFASYETVTGELHASTPAFMYMNNFATTQTLFDMLRNNTLVAYSGESSVAPMDYGGGNFNRNQGSGYFGSPYDQGQLYYNEDYNSYGPGVVPINNMGAVGTQPVYNTGLSEGIYNGETYGSGTGGMSGASFDDGSSYYQQPGAYNFGWNGPRQTSALATIRGQDVTYGDPGTLIYSAWFAALGGAEHALAHKDKFGYNAKQAGFLAGLDLFCSCDCRFGVYYGYQQNHLKNMDRLGKLRTNDHLIGLYHQFGDETIYNIATIRGGYDRYHTKRNAELLDEKDTLTAKYDGFNAGASFERGANFAVKPFVFSPYGSLDYNYFHRGKFTETSATGSHLALHAGKSDYHSLRGQIGGRVALDMYPGDQQIRLVARAAYVHEFLNPMYGKTNMSFVSLPNAPGGYNIYGNSLGRDWALLGLGADWTPVPALVLFVKGDYMFNKYVRDPFGSAGLKYRW
ncbi:MAG: autotransporter outer membrane beta-barrel domain-containing protein [Thermoguttaceae bacterium]|nr:autotransporter outer membrane beta-barrel domain-containing protein [Thermoguttaceae bacterium]